jgi:hypothetical protein
MSTFRRDPQGATGDRSTGRDVAGAIESGAREASANPWVTRLAHGGLAARGVIYLLIGWLALEVALGRGGREADQNGALRTVAAKPYGEVVLWLLAVGFAGYALWRFTEVALGETGGDRGWKGRVKSLVRGLVYGALCVTTVSLLIGAGNPSGGSVRQNQTMTAKLMAHSGGRWLVGLVGLTVVAVGAMMVYEGLNRKFLKYLRLGEMSHGTRRLVELLGVVGTVARGVVFAVAGVFVVIAAVRFDPQQARGLDGALKSIGQATGGQLLLGAVALGLMVFGVYGLAEARWRRTTAGDR